MKLSENEAGTRALVLTGGGSVGIAWQTGLAVGLARAGVQLADADLIVGTSAGSAVGAHLALREDLEAQIARRYAGAPVAAAGTAATGSAPAADNTPGAGLAGFLSIMAEAAEMGLPDEELGARLGAFALNATTQPEASLIGAFSDLADAEWPAPFCCTAVDTETGAFQVWDAKAGAPLDRAVASSCAVPGIFAPITINGRRYIDGGVRSGTNIDLAAGYDKVLVISVLGGAANIPGMERFAQRAAAEEAVIIEAGGALYSLRPDEQAAAAMGMNPMDDSVGPAAAAAGVAQGIREAELIATFWG
jgi:NTE family protein